MNSSVNNRKQCGLELFFNGRLIRKRTTVRGKEIELLTGACLIRSLVIHVLQLFYDSLRTEVFLEKIQKMHFSTDNGCIEKLLLPSESAPV
jgi:hypothetical protein